MCQRVARVTILEGEGERGVEGEGERGVEGEGERGVEGEEERGVMAEEEMEEEGEGERGVEGEGERGGEGEEERGVMAEGERGVMAEEEMEEEGGQMLDTKHSYSYSVVPRAYIQWNPSITDTIGNQNFVCYNEVSLTQGSPVYFR